MVVHLLYNRRLSWVVLAVVAGFRLLLVLHYTCHKITKGSLYRGASLSLWWYTYYITSGFAGCLGRRGLLYRLVGVALQVQKATNNLRQPLFRYSLLTENHLL